MSLVAPPCSGPLSEIEFWRERSVDLSGIRLQLDDPAVSSIVAVLEQAKSSYLAPFLNLRNLIHRWRAGQNQGRGWRRRRAALLRC